MTLSDAQPLGEFPDIRPADVTGVAHFPPYAPPPNAYGPPTETIAAKCHRIDRLTEEITTLTVERNRLIRQVNTELGRSAFAVPVVEGYPYRLGGGS